MTFSFAQQNVRSADNYCYFPRIPTCIAFAYSVLIWTSVYLRFPIEFITIFHHTVKTNWLTKCFDKNCSKDVNFLLRMSEIKTSLVLLQPQRCNLLALKATTCIIHRTHGGIDRWSECRIYMCASNSVFCRQVKSSQKQ